MGELRLVFRKMVFFFVGEICDFEYYIIEKVLNRGFNKSLFEYFWWL